MDKNYAYYLSNQNELNEEFGGSFIIIQNQNILKSLPSIKEAFQFLKSRKGSFLIQEINENTHAQTAMISH